MHRFILPSLRAALDSIGAPPGFAIVLEGPRHERGDLSTGVAMELAAVLRHLPLVIAHRIVEALEPDIRYVASVDVAAPGFINVRLTPAAFHLLLAEVEAAGPAYGWSPILAAASDYDPSVEPAWSNLFHHIRLAYARIAAIQRHAVTEGIIVPPDPTTSSLALLVEAAELDLIREILRLPASIKRATRNPRSHRHFDYLERLATATHLLLDELRIVAAEAQVRDARLRLLAVARTSIANGMGMFRLECPERM